jgi:hypothetical protein
MSGQPLHLETTILERLDLALARRVAANQAEREPVTAAERVHEWLLSSGGGNAAWIGALLRLRGFAVFDDDAAEVRSGRPSRLPAGSQEHALILGLGDALQMLRDRSCQGIPPDGWFLVELFKAATRGVPRFRGNALRADPPWDGQLYVSYPRPNELSGILDTFDASHRYRDLPQLFDGLHPVRQSFRVLWRLSRVAPFPDFNLPMAWLAMCSYLLCKGYPAPRPEPSDRTLLQRMVSGPPPRRVVQLEARLLASVEAG